MTRLAAVLTALAQLLAGVALVYLGAANLHVEMHRAEPSTVRVVLFGGLVLLGLLVAPTIGAALAIGARRGITLAALGRRAYDKGELPPPDAPSSGASP